MTIPRTKRAKDAGESRRTRPIASRVDLEFARATNCNFLTPAIVAAVEDRLRYKQPHETLDTTRLYADLLSSMPMCFNLFGSLHGDPASAAKAVAAWFPEMSISGATVTVGFEWSPGRRDPAFLGDRTAFDAVIRVGPETGGHLIGIETKYHEYPITQRRASNEEPPKRYVEVSKTAKLFRSADGVAKVWGTAMEQVWRDHLLALACQQHPAEASVAKYVLVAPAGNPVWKQLVAEYRDLLTEEAAATISYRTIEDLLSDDVLPHAALFRSRYLPATST